MKETIENSIKQSLENFEAPYNANAWTQMNARLDAQMPTTPKSNTKWYVAATAIVVVATASYLLFTGETTSADVDQTNLAQQENESATSSTLEETNSTNITSGTTSSSANDDGTNSSVSENSGNDLNQSVQPTDNGGTGNGSNGTKLHAENTNIGAPSNNTTNGSTNETNGSTTEENVGNNNNTTTSNALIVPSVADICQGQTITVNNTNASPLLVLGPDMYFIIPANEQRVIRANHSGTYSIGALESGTGTERIDFIVKDAPTVDFAIDGSTKFENGLPTTKLESTVPGTKFEWIFGGQKITGTEVDAHFYTKGEHNITLTVTGANGCTASETKPVYIEDKYNLMAVNSFRPNSNNPQTNTFMPYALTERRANFTLIIIDPTDGHVIYQTSDANQGWDGTDSRTGSNVAFENSYIWKVTINNIEPNEASNEYSGHIIPVHSNN